MQELDDIELLRECVEGGSEEAFATIVGRHVNKVYSVAWRHTRNASQAEEITQAVFVILAQKARYLGRGVILTGWLYKTARLTAVTFIRSEIRRSRREQEAHMETIANENEPEGWQQIAPPLDTAMTELNETDRHAVLLRYFDGKSMREVGGVLGATEDAAKKRLNRAVEKLQKSLRKRGIDSSAAALAEAISANALQGAPAALAKAVTAAALTKGAAASSSTLTLIKGTLKTMAWAKIKLAAAASLGVLLAAGGVTAIYETQKDVNASTEASAPGGDAAAMRLQWMVGKKYSMRVEFNQRTETPLPDQPEPTRSEVNFTLNFDITALEALANGGWQLELEFVSDSLDVVRGENKIMSFDSVADPKNPASAIVGARLEYFTDAEGKVERVQGMDDLGRRISATGKSVSQAVFKDIFSDETLRRFVSFENRMPNRTVAIGQSWMVKKNIAGMKFGRLAVDVKNTFKDWAQHDGRKCAHIEVSGDFSSKGATADSGMLMEIRKGKISGDVWYDPKLEMMVDSSSDQIITMKVTTQATTVTPQVREKIRMTLLDLQ